MRSSDLLDLEKLELAEDRLESAISSKETILPKFLLSGMKEMYICKICGWESKIKKPSSIIAHLFDRHKIKRGSRENGVSEAFCKYIKYHFGNPLCACGCKRKVMLHPRKLQYNLFAPDCKRKWRFLNPCCIEFYLFKGKTLEEAKAIISKLQRKNKSQECLDKLSKIFTGFRNPASYCSIINRTGLQKVKVKEILSIKTKGERNGFYGKHHKPETLIKLAASRSKQAKIVSKPELIVYGILAGMGFDFEYQCPIDKYIVDFKINNKIIEVYGDYWHSTKFLRGIKVDRDRIKVKQLNDLGYRLLVLWESDIMNHLTDVVESIREHFNEN